MPVSTAARAAVAAMFPTPVAHTLYGQLAYVADRVDGAVARPLLEAADERR